MNIIKLNATNSTNDYLKEIVRKQFLENFLVVVANNQLQGKGQRHSKWESEPGKNLTFSVLVRDIIYNPSELFILNAAVACSVFECVAVQTEKKCAIKWPNDIMADGRKISGILIENLIQQNNMPTSIVGIGLNLNQIEFKGLPHVTSLKLLEQKDFDLDLILNQIVNKLKENISMLEKGSVDFLWSKYEANLFRKEIPTTFENHKKEKFMGIIKGVSKTGQLKVLVEDFSMKLFSMKEIKMLYY
ncbi:MAG TPA: biotin--[acetyl-CoA-carboxylase] ligase [Flavobacterium sp.]|nr:biotin--[acetyl-CoA-carboxylase] ligase [Flavobacterium sp.]